MTDVFAIRLHAEVGFFAQLNWVMEALLHCRRRNLTPYIELTGGYSADSVDWSRAFFRWKNAPERPAHVQYASNKAEMGLCYDYHDRLTLPLVRELFEEHLEIQDWVLDRVRTFAIANSIDHHTLGLHYRGSDKMASESPYPVSQDDFWHMAKLYTDGFERIYAASDETMFATWLMQQTVLHVVENAGEIKCDGGTPVHERVGVNAAKRGFEALFNCLTLARCGFVVKTLSFLSGWAAVFNPVLDVVVVGEQHPRAVWFPDREFSNIPLRRP